MSSQLNAPVIKKNDDKKDDKKEESIKLWNDSEVQLLKKWGETAASYRLLHDRAYRYYNQSSYMFAVPIIVFSTITGTASFSQTLFPPKYQPYVPMVIGGVNIFIGILGTLARFFRVDELTEAHRVASVSYGKFSRNITTELSLPPQNRRYNGGDLVEMCRTELDRLIEQSPDIPMFILYDFKTNPEFKDVAKPEVLDVKPIEEYKMSKEEKVIEIVTSVVERLKQTKPEKTLVQQLAEKHSNGEYVPPRNIPKPPFIPPPPIQTNLTNTVQSSGNLLQNLTNNALKNIETKVDNQTNNLTNQVNNSTNQVLNSINGVVNSFSNPTLPNKIESTIHHTLDNSLNNIIPKNENNNESTINDIIHSGNKIFDEQKEKIQNELSDISNQGIVSSAKSKFQGLVKKEVTKEELGNTMKNILNQAIKENVNNNQVIQDIEMGIVKTNEMLQETKIDKNDK